MPETLKIAFKQGIPTAINGSALPLKDLIQKLNQIGAKHGIGITHLIEDRLIEINPRVSTFIFQDDLIEIFYSIELARGRVDKEEVRRARDRIDYGRKMIRYMDQVFFK